MSDKRSVATDALETLGMIIDERAKRDSEARRGAMTDLTDDELRARLEYAMGEPYGAPFVQPLRELLRHRAATAADKERVWQVVREAMNAGYVHPDTRMHLDVAAIADRAAEPALQLSLDDAKELAERRAMDHIRKAEIEEIVTRRQADLTKQERQDITWHIDRTRRAPDTGMVTRNALSAIERLIGAKP